MKYQATINKPTVVTAKWSRLRVHLIPAFGKLRLDQIDERMIDAYKVEKCSAGLGPSTINQQLKQLARMLRVARKWKVLRADLPEIDLLKCRQPSFDFLDFDEATGFLDAARSLPAWHPFMVVAVRTGLRVGEMAALRWREDIDLSRKRLRVQRSYSDKHKLFMTTKNDRIRELPLTWDACEALQAQRSSARGELVFISPRGGPLSSDTANNAVKRIAALAGLREIHTHVLRHTFASQAVMRSVPLRQVQEWMGHGSIVVTQRYAHLSEGLGDDLITRLAPDPPPNSEPGGARSQHTHSTRKSKGPKTVPQQP